MDFGLNRFKNTPAGQATTQALQAKSAEVMSAARAGEPPVQIIAPLLQDHLGTRHANALVGRLIREWLGPCFQIRGRKQWSRKNGTESGTYYVYVG